MSLVLKFEGDTRGLEKKLKKSLQGAGVQVKKLEKTTKKSASKMRQNFRMVTTSAIGMGAGIAGVGLIFRSLVRNLVGFEKAMAEVSTLVNTSTTDMAALSDEVLNLSTKVPKSAIDISKGLYQVISAGVTDAADAMKVLTVATGAAVAGLTDTNTSVDAITTVMNAYGKSVSQANDISDVFFTTIREGKTTFPELAASIGVVANSAALAGVKFEELGAGFATITKRGVNTAETATALNRLFLNLANPTARLKKITREMGLEFSAATLRAKGFKGFMEELVPLLDANENLIFELGLDMRAFKALAVLGGTGAKEFAKQLVIMETRAGAMATAQQKMTDISSAQFTLFKNKLNVVLQEFGSVILPVATSALETFNQTFTETGKAVAGGIPLGTALNVGMAQAVANMLGFKTATEEAAEVMDDAKERADRMFEAMGVGKAAAAAAVKAKAEEAALLAASDERKKKFDEIAAIRNGILENARKELVVEKVRFNLIAEGLIVDNNRGIKARKLADAQKGLFRVQQDVRNNHKIITSELELQNTQLDLSVSKMDRLALSAANFSKQIMLAQQSQAAFVGLLNQALSIVEGGAGGRGIGGILGTIAGIGLAIAFPAAGVPLLASITAGASAGGQIGGRIGGLFSGGTQEESLRDQIIRQERERQERDRIRTELGIGGGSGKIALDRPPININITVQKIDFETLKFDIEPMIRRAIIEQAA